MIKFAADLDGGGRLLGIGLTRANCERLVKGQPIALNTRKEFNTPWRADILIMGGETEEALGNTIRPFMDRETIVHVDPRLVHSHIVEPEHEKAEPGELCIGHNKGLVVLDLGREYTRVGFQPETARTLAEALLKEADAAEKHPEEQS